MASVAAGIIDPTKAGKYPVILSDALLGKPPKEVYTGVKYNHNPDEPPSFAKLKPTPSNNSGFSYDLSYKTGNSIYKYQGVRASEDGQYVLIFDSDREAFVLHKVDSRFNLNLIRTPTNNDAESLRQEYPHLPNSNIQASAKSKDAGKAKKQDKQSGSLTMPSFAAKPKPAPKKRAQPSDGEEESDDDDDGGLVMEFPGGPEPSQSRDFSPAFPPRRFSEFVKHPEDEEDADAEGEDDDEEMMEAFKLPSPINHQTAAPAQQAAAQPMTIDFTFDDDEDGDDDDGGNAEGDEDDDNDLDVDDLEAELEAELEQQGMESDVSEED